MSNTEFWGGYYPSGMAALKSGIKRKNLYKNIDKFKIVRVYDNRTVFLG